MRKRNRLTFEIFKNVKGEWLWHARRGGNILYIVSESYKSKGSMVKVLRNAILSVGMGEYDVECNGKPVENLWGIPK
jgi:uncharacterized protein YegP (UPF0339 family)